MLELFVDAALEAFSAGEQLSPAALLVLLRVYAETGRSDLGDALGSALALPVPRDASVRERAEWLQVYAYAAQLSEDARLREHATSIATEFEVVFRRAEGDRAPAEPTLLDRAAAVHAVLAASPVVGTQRFAPPAIDELERLVARDYAPGEGLRRRTAGEHVAVALALLAAFDVSGRLAYPMLAEELIRSIRLQLRSAPSAVMCTAARVFGRLARLHADHGYRATAVLAPDADYARAAAELLDASASACATTDDAAAYALALAERAEGS